MRVPIAIFYHAVFLFGDPPVFIPEAIDIISDQMSAIKQSGLEDAADQIHIGINGGIESEIFTKALLPEKAHLAYHGLQCRSENRTMKMLHDFALSKSEEWHILYFHPKGASHAHDCDYARTVSTPWRNRMMKHVIYDWRQCIADMPGYHAVGCHWIERGAEGGFQRFFGGAFWWARASFLRDIPSLLERDRIKQDGLDSFESRYENEVWIGNGPYAPVIKSYYNGGIGS